MNKVMSYQIINPVNIDWKTLSDIMRIIQKETRVAENRTISICKEWTDYCKQFYQVNKVYPKLQDVHSYKMINGLCYDKIKSETVILNSGNLSTSINVAISKYKTKEKDIIDGLSNIPCFKKDLPIDLHKNNIDIYKENDKYYITLGLLSNVGKNEYGLKERITIHIKVKDNTQKSIIDKCISGEYSKCSSQIIRKNNKWVLNLCYGFEPLKTNLDKEKIMGIDLGIAIPVYMAFNFNDNKREYIKDERIIQNKIRLDKELSYAKSQARYSCEGSIGHGKNNRMKCYNKYSNKSHYLSQTINHTWSGIIVNTALKNNCGIIQMENLSGYAENHSDDKFLKNWTYYDLQSKIKYKAEEKGIQVIMINPSYTSQRCSKCGYIHKNNRLNQSIFKCMKCGYTTNADFNASKNIATNDIENIIKETKSVC